MYSVYNAILCVQVSYPHVLFDRTIYKTILSLLVVIHKNMSWKQNDEFYEAILEAKQERGFEDAEWDGPGEEEVEPSGCDHADKYGDFSGLDE